MYSFCRCFGGQPEKNISSQDPPLDESKEKRLRLPSPKDTNGRVGVSGYRPVFVSGYCERARQRMAVGMSSCSSGNVVAALPRRLCNRSVPLEYKTRMSGSSSYRRTPIRPFAHSPFRFLPPRPLHSLSFTTHYTLYGSRFSGHQTRRAEEPSRRTSEVSLTTRS
jgi:hypothetical protein